MNKIKYALLFFGILLLVMACAKPHHPFEPDETGEMPILMNLAPALSQNINVSSITVTITHGDFSSTQQMQIEGTQASCVFDELQPGVYAIDVWVYNDNLLIATGQGTGTVSPGESTTVYITLQFVGGGLEIVVDWGEPWQAARRVLLIGNSHTYFNGGVNTHLQYLIDEARPDWNVLVQARTAGGYTLENHFNDPTTINTITSGNWDLVVLQEQSSRPMNDPLLFYQSATALDSVITASGGITGFYMTWAWRNNPEMYEPIRDAYNYIGAFLHGMVAPAGVAYYNSSQTDPDVDLYDADNYHPSPAGTYLVACTMLAAIWYVNPIGLNYFPTDIDSHTAQYLQQIAWQTVSSRGRWQHKESPVVARWINTAGK